MESVVMDRLFETFMDSQLEDAQFRAFEAIDERLKAEGVLPSQVETYLNRYFGGLGDAWQDWWNESGEEYK